MKHFFFSALLILTLISCVNTKKFGYVIIPKGQDYYDRIDSTNFKPAGTTDSIFRKALKTTVKASLTANSDGSLIPFPIIFVDDTVGKTILLEPGRKAIKDLEPIGSFFPILQDSNKSAVKNTLLSKSEKFQYTDIHFVIQALTIPFKYRFKVGDNTLSTATADFNIGVALGWKITKNTYRKFYSGKKPDLSALSDYTSNWSFTPGFFLAPTVVDLDSAHTAGKVTMDRSVFGLTAGVFFVAGYNDFNLGLAFGFEKTFGSGPSSWIYNGKPWVGLVFAVDVFK